MNSDDVAKLSLIPEGEMRDIPSGGPSAFSVTGLPSHLKAKVTRFGQSGFRYELYRGAESYRPNQPSRTPEIALQSLKSLLNWDPI